MSTKTKILHDNYFSATEKQTTSTIRAVNMQAPLLDKELRDVMMQFLKEVNCCCLVAQDMQGSPLHAATEWHHPVGTISASFVLLCGPPVCHSPIQQICCQSMVSQDVSLKSVADQIPASPTHPLTACNATNCCHIDTLCFLVALPAHFSLFCIQFSTVVTMRPLLGHHSSCQQLQVDHSFEKQTMALSALKACWFFFTSKTGSLALLIEERLKACLPLIAFCIVR